MQEDPDDLDRFKRHLTARMTIKGRIDKSRAELAAILPALLYWCSERSGPDPVTGQPYFELKTEPDLRETETRDVRAVAISPWNGKDLAISVNEQGGGILVGDEFFEAVTIEDPGDVATIVFVPPKGGRTRADRTLVSLLRPLNDHAFQPN